MSERVKTRSPGPEQGEVFKSDFKDGYLEGYEGREFLEGAERPADFAAAGDWGRQGEWGAFSNRPGFKRDETWPEELGSDLVPEESQKADEKA